MGWHQDYKGIHEYDANDPLKILEILGLSGCMRQYDCRTQCQIYNNVTLMLSQCHSQPCDMLQPYKQALPVETTCPIISVCRKLCTVQYTERLGK